jgi:tRNA A-37 threonylcarbamoyl transferase component Bud32
MFYRMYWLKLSHGDMKATNIKVLDGKPYLIDLDSMQQHAWDFLAKKRHAKDLKRFMRNWQDQPTLYNTFVKAFFAVYADSQVLRLAGLSVD